MEFFDDVIDRINKKPAPKVPPEKPPANPPAETPPAPPGGKRIHSYSKEFEEQFGKRKKS